MTATAEPEVGRARLRKEDARLIAGRTRWTDNLSLPGMLHMAILRSPMAHARIRVDASAAREMPGVEAVITGADIAEEQGSLPCAWPITEDMKAPDAPSLAVDTVNFAGEAVACVAARSAAEARDALEAIEVDYEDLPVVLDMREAVADGADLVHPDLGTNKSATWVFDSAEAGSGGDAEQAVAEAEVVLERTFRQQRLIPAFMEPRSVVVDPTGEQMTMWSATQVPHILRVMLAMTVGAPEHKIRIIAPDVGGGFGGKGHVYPEDMLLPFLAKRAARPVRWIETRREHLACSCHSRDQFHEAEIAFDAEGRILALRDRFTVDCGAWNPLGVGVVYNTAAHLSGPYRIPHLDIEARVAATNKVPPTSTLVMAVLAPSTTASKNLCMPRNLPFAFNELYATRP
jgi:aerobic carbon-monoxide dehydrogenase large subunit